MEAQLTVIQGTPQGECFSFRNGSYVFGRGPECHLRPGSPAVSGQRCQLRVRHSAVSVLDLDSASGTFVNGYRILTEQTVVTGDQIRSGALVLRVRLVPQNESREAEDGWLVAKSPLVDPSRTSTQGWFLFRKLFAPGRQGGLSDRKQRLILESLLTADEAVKIADHPHPESVLEWWD